MSLDNWESILKARKNKTIKGCEFESRFMEKMKMITIP